ncbi:hypothetical protein IH979_01395 [Patescibacteria group bacterium]|nr:hypothetical protein [Patescibacteria group bacterium]
MKNIILGALFGIGIMLSGLAAAQVPAFVKTITSQRGTWEKHLEMKAGDTINITATGLSDPLDMTIPPGKKATVTLQVHLELFNLP